MHKVHYRIPRTKSQRIHFCSGYYDPRELKKYKTKQLFHICMRVIEEHERLIERELYESVRSGRLVG